MKKVLILTETAGNGHNSCARAMKNRLEAFGNVEVKVVDILKEFSTAWNAWVVDGGYNFVVSKMPHSYDAFYNKYLKSPPEKRYSNGAQGVVKTTLNGLMKEILSYQPDVVYCTHYNCAIAITNLKLVYDLPCKSIVANLDYVNSPFWESAIGVDYFAIPNEDFVAECKAEGFREEQLLPIGLPVDDRSLIKLDKKEAREKLGLAQDKFTIMVMFGGGCWSGGFKIFKWLISALKGREAQVIMINGKDKTGYEKIEKMTFEDGIKVLNVGFTYDIPVYLSAADLILNKFGGISVTEMINAELPMLITEQIPAQEKYNLQYMKSKGVALSFKTSKELKQNLHLIMDNESLRNGMSENTKSLKKDALNSLAKFIMELPNADYTKLIEQGVNIKKVRKEVATAMRKADKQEKEAKRTRKKELKVAGNRG